MPQTSVDWAPPIAMDGLLDPNSARPHVESVICDEATGIKFGRAVMLKSGASKTVDLPASSGEIATTYGIALRDPTKEQNSDGAGAYADGEGMPAMIEGVAWVQVEDAVVAYSAPFIRFAAGAVLNEPGRFRSDAGDEGGGALAAVRTGWMFLDNAPAGGFARVKVVR